MNPEVITHFQAGHLTKNGFLGTDLRSIEEIIRQDKEFIFQSGISNAYIADRLQWFIHEGKKALESRIQLGDFFVQIQYDRGMLPCPFGDPGLHPKVMANVTSPKMGKQIRYSQLSVHMIRQHGFYGGKGSLFRLEPGVLVTFISGGEK